MLGLRHNSAKQNFDSHCSIGLIKRNRVSLCCSRQRDLPFKYFKISKIHVVSSVALLDPIRHCVSVWASPLFRDHELPFALLSSFCIPFYHSHVLSFNLSGRMSHLTILPVRNQCYIVPPVAALHHNNS